MAERMTTDQLRQHLAMTRDSDGLPRHEREYAEQILESIDAALFVPGLWRCTKCNFNLVLKTLHARTGAVTARTSAGETCPNCDTALERVSYKDAFNEQQQRFEDYLLASSAERDARDQQANELKRRACFVHALCYQLSIKHPEITELGDDGALHCAIHAILAVDIGASPGSPIQPTGALPGEGVPAPWVAPPVPSRFQIGEQVRAGGVKGDVVAVTFAVIDGQAKVFYDIAHSAGVLVRVCSGRVQPATPSHLRAVPDVEGVSHE